MPSWLAVRDDNGLAVGRRVAPPLPAREVPLREPTGGGAAPFAVLAVEAAAA